MLTFSFISANSSHYSFLLLIYQPFIHSCFHSFIHSFFHSTNQPFIHSYFHSFIHSFLHLINQSGIYTFMLSFIHSFFLRSFAHSFMYFSILLRLLVCFKCPLFFNYVVEFSLLYTFLYCAYIKAAFLCLITFLSLLLFFTFSFMWSYFVGLQLLPCACSQHSTLNVFKGLLYWNWQRHRWYRC